MARRVKVISFVEEASDPSNLLHSLEFQKRVRDGLCPKCGEKGAFIHGKAVCSVHGPYEFIKIGDKRSFEIVNEGA